MPLKEILIFNNFQPFTIKKTYIDGIQAYIIARTIVEAHRFHFVYISRFRVTFFANQKFVLHLQCLLDFFPRILLDNYSWFFQRNLCSKPIIALLYHRFRKLNAFNINQPLVFAIRSIPVYFIWFLYHLIVVSSYRKVIIPTCL